MPRMPDPLALARLLRASPSHWIHPHEEENRPMNSDEVVDMIRAWDPPPFCEMAGCGAMHDPGTYHGRATMIRDAHGESKVVALIKPGEPPYWNAEIKIHDVFTGDLYGPATLRLEDGREGEGEVDWTRYELNEHVVCRLSGRGASPTSLPLTPSAPEGTADA